MLSITQIIVIPLVIYFVWTKIIMMYVKYFYYRMQGMPTTGFPLPLLGNIVAFVKAQKNKDQFSAPP
jgi:hypothetical protein